MKVLMIAGKSEFGGAPKCMLELMDILKDKEDITFEAVTHGKAKITEWCSKRGIRSYAVGHIPFAVGKGSTPIRRIAKSVLTPYYFLKIGSANKKAFKMACEVIDFSDIDIIHTNSNRDCLGAMLAAKYNIPHIWHLREFGKEDYDIRYLKPEYIDFMNKNTTRFVAISDAVRKAWIEKGIDPKKIIRIYDGIHLPSDEIVRKARSNKQNTSDRPFRIAYLGIVCPSKGQFEAVKALSLLDKELLKNIRIDFWGDCNCLPEFTKQMKKYAESHGFQDSVKFKGVTDSVWKVLPEYDAALVCSRSEAFGRITPEYMSLGLQVIASDKGANPELIENGSSGYIYRFGDIKQLAELIAKAYHLSHEKREKISVCAEKRALLFSDKNNAKEVYRLYTEILKK